MYQNYGWKYVLTAFLAVCAALAWQMNGLSYGLDLSGGDEIIYKLDFGAKEKSLDTTDDVVEVIRKRLDVLGIKELSIARLGNFQFVVQVPNASDQEVKKIRSQIERAGQLYFKMLADTEASGLSETEVQQLVETVRKQKRSGTWKENSRWDVAQWGEGARGQPGTYELLENATSAGKPLYVSGDLLANAYQDQDQRGLPAVGFEWNAQGAKAFYELTYNHRGRNLAVVLDGKLRSAPTIRSAIRRRGIIEGGDKGWDRKELTALIITLKAGSLPAKPVFAYRKHVGPQLGQAAVRIGKWSIGGALLIIVLFMLVYYNLKSGLIADIALALNLLFIIGILALFKATLTLPGIAGILLTAGMAVDANILIFERIREEVARGSAVKQAIQAGYDRAFWTIFDANLTTALTALILMWVGTGPIKGFGLTLTIGILSSMFTALFVTRALYGFFVNKGILTDVTFRQLFKKPALDFIGNWSKALTVSLALIAAGWLVFLSRGDDKYGIDFTGGTAMQMRLKAPKSKAEVQTAIEDHFLAQGIDLSKLQLDIQRVGLDLDEGDGESSTEWSLRSRLVGSNTGEGDDQSALPPLLNQAFGQGDVGEVDSADPPGDVSDVDSSDRVEAEATPPPLVITDDDEPQTTSKDQDFFQSEVSATFEDELVAAYPKLDGQPYRVIEKGALAEITLRVNLVPLLGDDVAGTTATAKVIKADGSSVVGPIVESSSDEISITVGGKKETFKTADVKVHRVYPDLITKSLPAVLNERLSKLRDRGTEPERERVVAGLVGTPEAPGFMVVQVEGLSEGEAVETFDITFTVNNLKKDREDAIDAMKGALEKARDAKVLYTPAFPFPNIDTIGSAVARNLKSKAIVATFFSVIFICLYVWLRFDFWSGIAAIVAVFHDVLALLGFLSILDFLLGKAGINYDVKFSLTTISAFLTLVGYSINDTIVILDRIREDKKLAKAKTYTAELINEAINKTLGRTVLTSLTSFMVCSVLFVGSFAGLAAIQGLSVALLFGVVVGTYSSVFVAAPILVADKKKVVQVSGAVVLFMIVSAIVSIRVAM